MKKNINTTEVILWEFIKNLRKNFKNTDRGHLKNEGYLMNNDRKVP